jgi:hypothetical protein
MFSYFFEKCLVFYLLIVICEKSYAFSFEKCTDGGVTFENGKEFLKILSNS